MDVLRLAQVSQPALSRILDSLGIALKMAPPGDKIPGSYWGECEAGIIKDTLYARPDTPLHSIAHEACHMLCMDPGRRRQLHTDARGDDLEECAVCYLQILIADALPGMTRQRMFADMDAWGYSFRSGSAQAWFERDAQDAAAWLRGNGAGLEASPFSQRGIHPNRVIPPVIPVKTGTHTPVIPLVIPVKTGTHPASSP